MSLLLLNDDVFGVLLDKIGTMNVWRLSCLSKKSYKLTRKILKNTRVMMSPDITLRLMQGLVRKEFLSMNRGVLAFRARPNFGKTLLGYSCLHQKLPVEYSRKKTIVGTGIVLVKSPYDKVWLEEADKLGWYCAEPRESKVVFAIPARVRHLTYAAQLEKMPTNQIFVVSETYIDRIIKVFEKIIGNERISMVIDEAHKSGQLYSMFTELNRCIIIDKIMLLSAERYEGTERTVLALTNSEYKQITIKDEGSKIPKVRWNFVKINSNPLEEANKIKLLLDNVLEKHNKVSLVLTGNLSNFIVSHITAYNKSIEDSNKDSSSEDSSSSDSSSSSETIIRKRGRKPVNKKKTSSRNKSKKEPLPGTVKLYVQKTGIKTIGKFNDAPETNKCLLLINTGQNIGINVHSSAHVIVGAGHHDVRTTCQTVSRVVRAGNKRKYVDVYMVAIGDHQYNRSIYARCFYGTRDMWPFPLTLLPTSEHLVKSLSIMRLMGENPETINNVDGQIIFSLLTPDIADDVVEWWNINKTSDTCLSEGAIRAIIGDEVKSF